MAHISLPLDNAERLTLTEGFRHDINLLRGIAIAAVVAYHFAPLWAPGGFAGVDIFFVVSGFLMTKIICGGQETGTFNLFTFYIARCKRIIPALYFMCAVLFLLSWLWFPSLEFKAVGQYISYVVLFISNIKLNKDTAGYFTADSHENWFLHTWSLSVEWQFYLVLPLVLIVAYRFRKKIHPSVTMVLLTLASFISIFCVNGKHTASTFYLMPFRAWEMLCGGLVWHLAKNKWPSQIKLALTVLGYLTIFASIAFIKPAMQWPSFYTWLPVLGTMFVILGNEQYYSAQVGRSVQWLGLSSYSIYLWHWPVVVLLSYADRQHNVKWIVAGICASIVAGYLSWLLIENPTKKSLSRVSKPQFWAVIFSAILMIYGVSTLARKEIITNHPNQLMDSIAREAVNKNYAADTSSGVSYYGQGPLKAIMVGDSHAEATVTALAQAAVPYGSVMGLTYSGCPTLFNAHRVKHKGCDKFNQSLLNKLSEYPGDVPVIIVNRISHYVENKLVSFDNSVNEIYSQQFAQSLINTACELSQQRQVYLVKPIPEMPHNVPRVLSHALMFGKKPEDVTAELSVYNQRNKTIIDAQDTAAKQCGVKILDPTRELCRAGVCYGSHSLQPLYFDDNHLSESGNKNLVPMFAEIFATSSPSLAGAKPLNSLTP
ncbi:acyltransferase family protein [Atlantibacter subterraneus]|uniref:acyltransferase family protein n=1 Tax=Atlantibacter subterraneus TaxID=255519 RepID=UPI002FDDD00E